MGLYKPLDVEGRTLLIRLWKVGKALKEIASILDVPLGTVSREIRALRTSGLIVERAKAKQQSKSYAKPAKENADPRQNRAMRECLRCHRDFDSAWIGNRSCKNCTAAAAGVRAIK